MKFLSKIFFIAILSGIFLLNITCNKKVSSKFPYNGHVYDSIGGKPVQGVSVMLYACSKSAEGMSDCDQTFEYATITTDKTGYFTFGYIHEAVSNRYGIWLNSSSAYISYDGINSAQTDFIHGSATKTDLQSTTYSKLYLK